MPPANAAWMHISELSRRVGVRSDTLRAWERRYGLLKPRRTAGNVRLYSQVDEARVRLMKRYIAQQIPAAQAAELSITTRLSLRSRSGIDSQTSDLTKGAGDLRRALDELDETRADQTLQQLLIDHSTVAVLRHVILPYLHEIGERWAADHMTVAREHFAANFLQFRLASLSRGWDRGLGPLALLACAPDEQHTLALISFGIALRQHGWRISYLGAVTPIEMVRRAASRLAPSLTVICAYDRLRLEPHASELRQISDRWRLAVAGAGADAELAETCGAEFLDEDPVSAAVGIALTT